MGVAQADRRELPGAVLASLGGIAARSDDRGALNAVGARLVRAAAGQEVGAGHAFTSLVRRLNQVRRWRLSSDQVEKVAEIALDHYMRPACPHCGGHGFLPSKDLPALTAVSCAPCEATGVRKLRHRLRGEIAYTLNIVDSIVDVTVAAARARVG